MRLAAVLPAGERRGTDCAGASPQLSQAQSQTQAEGQPPAAAQAQPGAAGSNAAMPKLVVTVGKSLIIDSPASEIRRLSVANGDLAEAVAVNPKEVLINGKMPGETSLIVWQQNGARLIYDLTVRMSSAKLEAARQQIARDFPTEDINLTFENDTAFVRGTVRDVTAADRVMMIASTLGKAINLLRVDVPGRGAAGRSQSEIRQCRPGQFRLRLARTFSTALSTSGPRSAPETPLSTDGVGLVGRLRCQYSPATA